MTYTSMATLKCALLWRLIWRGQHDTICCQDHSHPSLLTPSRPRAAGRRAVGLEELETYGSSLRFYARAEDAAHEPGSRVEVLPDREYGADLHVLASHEPFANQVLQIKNKLVGLLLDAATKDLSLTTDAARRRGSTSLNPYRIRCYLLIYTIGRSLVKRESLLPEIRSPINAETRPALTGPEHVPVLSLGSCGRGTDQSS